MFGLDTLSQAPISALATFPTLYPVNVNETCTSSDSFTAQVDFAGVRVDEVTLTDEGPGSYNFFGYVSDSIDLPDDFFVRFDANPTTSETVTLTLEDIGSAFAFNKQVDETFTTTEVLTGSIDYNDPAVTETTTFTDAETGYRGQFPVVTETTTLTTTQVSQVDFAPAVTETTTLTDTRSSQVAFAPVVTETTTVTTEVPLSGWIKVDDQETSVWVPVNNIQ